MSPDKVDAHLKLLAAHYESARSQDLMAPKGALKDVARNHLVAAERALRLALFQAEKPVDFDGYLYATDGIDLYRTPSGKPRRKIRSGPRNRSKGRADA